MERPRYKTMTPIVTALAVIGSVALLTVYAFKNNTGYALLSTVVVGLFVLPFFMSLEMRRPRARDIVPIAVMAALGTVGRIAFAAIPSVKPTTAIVIIAGAVFGPQAGFLTGAVCALASNFFFGQGAWTPWQMLAWGLCGLMAGVFKNDGLIRGTKSLALYGLIAAFFFGLMMNSWHIIGFVNPITLVAVLAALSAGVVFDVSHALSTAVILLLIGGVWIRKLERIKIKFGILQVPPQ